MSASCRRIAQVTARRTKIDFVGFVCRMLRDGCSRVRLARYAAEQTTETVSWGCSVAGRPFTPGRAFIRYRQMAG
jgi:hypothetical protein